MLTRLIRKKSLRRWLVGEFSWGRLVRSLLLIYCCVGLYLYWSADAKVFFPPPSSYQDSPTVLKIPTEAGIQLSARYLLNPAAQYTILYSHGNAEDLGHIRPVLDILYQAEFSVLAYDYRGYGTSEGRPSEANSYRDITAVYHYLVQSLQVPPERVILHGRSLGGAIAVDLASREPVADLILESTFISLFRVVVPFPILPFEKFHSIAKLPRVQAPILILHGTADTTIPLWHGQQLFAVAAEPKQSWWVEAAGHNDLVWVGGDRYPATLSQFALQIK
jgi:hypothetical protein